MIRLFCDEVQDFGIVIRLRSGQQRSFQIKQREQLGRLVDKGRQVMPDGFHPRAKLERHGNKFQRILVVNRVASLLHRIIVFLRLQRCRLFS